MNEALNENIFQDEPEIYNKKTQELPPKEKKNDVDLDHTLYNNIIDAGLSSQIDLASINSLSQTAQTRNEMYNIFDTMCEDGRISSVIETYADDSTQRNDAGNIVWGESSDSKISQLVNFILDSFSVNKNIYKWIYSLCKYGDVYLRLYRESEYEDQLFSKKKKDKLNEDVKIKAYKNNDRYALYMEMVSNPAEMFELTRFGKTMGYIKADIDSVVGKTDNLEFSTYKYKFKQQDITIYEPTEFVHASLENGVDRNEETVDIFLNQEDYDSGSNGLSYGVRKGESLLADVFQDWRSLQLLEASVLLNRLTKSSIIRLVSVNVGDMPKENVPKLLMKVKQMVEQKAALSVNQSLNEYTNPGPIENTVYVPVRGENGIGSISISQLGGDVDVKGLADLDYFINRLYGNLRVPKQYFSNTDDSAGFNGGSSLSIISSRYAKEVVRIQNTMIQALTDAVNLVLIDKGLMSYVNNFTIKMLPPVTQEEIDRRESMSSKVQLTSDIMNMLSDVEDPIIKNKMLKSLLSNVLEDSEVIELLQKQIDDQEAQQEEEDNEQEETPVESEGDNIDLDIDIDNTPSSGSSNRSFNDTFGQELGAVESPEPSEEESGGVLPSPADLGADLDLGEE